MRARMWLAAVAAGLGWAGAASAQSALTWGPVDQPLVFQVANTNASQVPISGPMVRSNSFSLTSVFANVGNISNQHVYGSSNFPTQAQMPGSSYLNAFGVQRPASTPLPWWHRLNPFRSQ
jgi:hypothetical protein